MKFSTIFVSIISIFSGASGRNIIAYNIIGKRMVFDDIGSAAGLRRVNRFIQFGKKNQPLKSFKKLLNCEVMKKYLVKDFIDIKLFQIKN